MAQCDAPMWAGLMAAFFNSQLDFIFFFYGLAFILLGTVCFAIARGGSSNTRWQVLGLFAYIHGLGEWLDLTALVIGDTPIFAAVRTAIMAVSYAFLLEFPRLEAVRLGYKLPGRWIHAVLLLIVVGAGAIDGGNVANAIARYILGLPGALGTAAVFTLQVRSSSDPRCRWAMFAAIGFALYAIAAGVIVPAGPWWPASAINLDAFVRLTGIPIQFVRGMLACWIAFCIWAFWGHQLIRDVASAQFTRFMHRQFVLMLSAMVFIAAVGWMLTEYLGQIQKQNVQTEARSELDLIVSRLTGETAIVDGMAKTLAGSPSVRALLSDGSIRDDAVNALVNLHVEASGAKFGYILDRSGALVASGGAGVRGHDISEMRSSSYFRRSLAGEAGHLYIRDATSGDSYYFASYPVRGQNGEVIGVAVLQRSLRAFESDLMLFDRPVFVVNADGIVMLTNRPDMMLRALWPLSSPPRHGLTGPFAALNEKPLLASEVASDTWVTIGGARDYIRRQPIARSDWSLVLLTVPRGLLPSRVLGIIITLQMATLALAYLVGRQRWVQDNILLGKQRELEEVARSLDEQATTDPLTGLYNRLKLNQQLAIEMMRAERYKVPLSLVLFDIDNFKRVNDSYGHQVGDQVLIDVSHFVRANIRDCDLLARWGGEEFVIVVPGSGAKMTCLMAQKLRDGVEAFHFDAVGTVTCSFGVAQYESGDTAETLIARADTALYLAKVKGRNRVEVAAVRDRIESAA
jgi:diguanylate cyclase (GGDEF)-like protein